MSTCAPAPQAAARRIYSQRARSCSLYTLCYCQSTTSHSPGSSTECDQSQSLVGDESVLSLFTHKQKCRPCPPLPFPIVLCIPPSPPTPLFCSSTYKSPNEPDAILWCSLSCVLSISQSSFPSVGMGTELLGCCPVVSASGTAPATGGGGASGALASNAPDCSRGAAAPQRERRVRRREVPSAPCCFLVPSS